jgi:serine/threonine protein kinase
MADPPRRTVSVRGPRHTVHKFPECPGLTFGKCLGHGHFSHVYEGTFNTQSVAIKVIERGSERSVAAEIALLSRLRGHPHIIHLHEVIEQDSTFLVFDLCKGISSRRFHSELTVPRFRHVLRCVLEALKTAHNAQIVHRDVKLGNILIGADWQDVKLIDWGCGTVISGEMSCRAGSRTVRSPEMLLGSRRYGTGGDVWAVGVLIYATLCHGDVPWKAGTAWDLIAQLSRFFGKAAIEALAEKHGVEIPGGVQWSMRWHSTKKFGDGFSWFMKGMRDPDLLDLAQKMLMIDADERITIEQALQHPFFTRAEGA